MSIQELWCRLTVVSSTLEAIGVNFFFKCRDGKETKIHLFELVFRLVVDI